MILLQNLSQSFQDFQRTKSGPDSDIKKHLQYLYKLINKNNAPII